MSTEQTDQRIVRTKRMIRDALTELMEKKGFEGITVKDLTEKAKINRGTFYLHYRDKFDLMEQSQQEIIDGIETIIQTIDPKDALAYTSQDQPFPVIVKLFEHFQENAQFMRAILGPKGDAAFQVKLKEFIVKAFLRYLFPKLNPGEMLVPSEIITAYVSSAHLGVVQYWLASGMEKTPRDMALILARLTLLGPGAAIGLKNN